MFSNLLFKFSHFSYPEIFGKYSLQELKELSIDPFLLPNILCMVNWLDNLRNVYGKPIRLTSSYRNSEHNTRVGGSKTSQHKYGLALDFQPFCKNGVPSHNDMLELAVFAADYAFSSEMIGQLIIHSNYIHVGAMTPDIPFSVRVIDFPAAYELLKSRNYPLIQRI